MNQGYVYGIIFPCGSMYIGSTTQRLSSRLYFHTCVKNVCVTNEYFQKYPDTKLGMLEKVKYKINKKDIHPIELKLRARYWQDLVGMENLINTKRAIVFPGEKAAEKAIQMKKWYVKNRDRIRQNDKQRKREKIPCDKCDKIVARGGITRHKKSNYCINFSATSK